MDYQQCETCKYTNDCGNKKLIRGNSNINFAGCNNWETNDDYNNLEGVD